MDTFDYKAYSEYMDAALVGIKNLGEYTGDEFIEITRPISEFLDIAKFTIKFYENMRDYRFGKYVFDECMYQKVEDENYFDYLMHEERTIADTVIVLEAYKGHDDNKWTEFEKTKIHNFLELIFVHSGRIRLSKILGGVLYFDRDSGLPNMKMFHKEYDRIIDDGNISEYIVAFSGVNSMAKINQTYGRDLGTELLFNYIRNLSNIIAEDGIVARVGGDNFTVLFKKNRFEEVKTYLEGATVDPKVEGKEEVLVTTCTGMFELTDDILNASVVIDKAFEARTIAKNVLREPCVFYNEKIIEKLSENKIYEEYFPDAIANEEFKVYYQPKVNLKKYSLCGAEALCRWERDGELIQPFKFIPLFERSTLICELDFYMLNHVCMDIRRWLDEGKKLVPISVNLSRRHFGNPGLLNTILSIIDSNNVPHEYIEIELTETTTDVDYNYLKDIVYGLKSVGIRTTVDDFGVGYSSLNIIRELPWDVIKIDKSFLYMCDGEDVRENIMLKHIIALTQNLGIECIVEGVETSRHIKLLKENNCFNVQGYYFDKPMDVDQFEKRLNYLELE